MVGAGGLVGAHFRSPRTAKLAGALGLLAGPGGAGVGPGARLGGDPAAGVQVGRARGRSDQCIEPAGAGVQLGAALLPAPGFPGESVELGVDLRDPLLTMRGASGRADVPGPAGDVPTAQRAVTPAPVRGHAGLGAGVVEADAAQYHGD